MEYTATTHDFTALPAAVVHTSPPPLYSGLEQELPKDTRLEQLVLSLLFCPGAQRYIDILTTDDFADPFFRFVFHLIKSGHDVPTTLVHRRADVERVTGESNPSAAFMRLFTNSAGADTRGLPWWLHLYVKELKEVSGQRRRVIDCQNELCMAIEDANEWRPLI